MVIKYIFIIFALFLAGFLFAPQEFYRLNDLLFSDAKKFEAKAIGTISVSRNDVYQESFKVDRSGYYEFGVIINDSSLLISQVESDFDKPITVEIFTASNKLLIKEEITSPKFFKPVDGTIDLAEKVVFLVMPINTIKNGNDFIIKISDSNTFLSGNKRTVYASISGYN